MGDDEGGKAGRDEDNRAEGADGDQSRLDRELIELLNELRVVLPGVQVLFAFLLTVPFTNRFSEVTSVQRSVYFAVLLLAAGATGLFLTPTAFHRIRFRRRDKEALLQLGNRMVILGMGALAVAIAASIFLIADLLFSRVFAVTVGAGAALFLLAFWYALPLVRHAREEDSG